MPENNTTIKAVVSSMIGHLAPRNRDVIIRRFGLKTGKKETLESIGASYSITRERVRQIEEASLRVMRESMMVGGGSKLQPHLELAHKIVADHGGVVKEETMFEAFSGSARENQVNAALVFALTLEASHIRHPEDENFFTFWSSSETDRTALKNTITSLVSAFEKKNTGIAEGALADFTKQSNLNISPARLKSYIEISKKIDRNVFGEIGLVSWPTVKPRGVRDKSYLVLKRAQKPQHFREIAQLINKASFSNKKAHVQTVHNELIKDDRFVLVGRGMYGLREWGYAPGTVKEVIVDLLNEKGPMAKDDIIAHVMSARFVKQNTIILGMQDKRLFEEENGRLKLKEV